MLHDKLMKELIARRDTTGADVTTVDEVMADFSVERSDAVDVLKKLAERGMGVFRVGRGSSGDFKTRIEWLERRTPHHGQTSTLPSKPEPQKSLRSVKRYEFTLDAHSDIMLELPRDLSANEAERIC